MSPEPKEAESTPRIKVPVENVRATGGKATAGAKTGPGSRGRKGGGKGSKGGKGDPDKPDATKPKKARSAYNFYLLKRIAQVLLSHVPGTWYEVLSHVPGMRY